MMEILSHRGYWKEISEKNTISAFERSFQLGFGIETDLRDQNGKIVISHDMPQSEALLFTDLLKLLKGRSLTLALNIKADGLAKLLNQIMLQNTNIRSFVFDMSIPDMKTYLELGMNVFTRLSDVEQIPIWLEKAKGVWLDAFDKDWYTTDTIINLLEQGKQVCIVSPELHGREYIEIWKMLDSLKKYSGLMLCTDYPEDAQSFFFGDIV